MTKIALVDMAEGTVLQVWPVAEGQSEVADRVTLPSGNQVSPVVLGWEMGDYAVLPVTEGEIPKGKRRAGSALYEVVDGVVMETIPIEDIPPPARVTARQFKLQLLYAGLLDDVEGWVAQQSQDVRIAWAASSDFLRSEPMMQQGFADLGLTEQQIDDFFRAASQL